MKADYIKFRILPCLAQFKISKLEATTILPLSLAHPSLSSCFGTTIAPSVASASAATWSSVTLAVVRLRRSVYYAMVSVAALPVATSTVWHQVVVFSARSMVPPSACLPPVPLSCLLSAISCPNSPSSSSPILTSGAHPILLPFHMPTSTSTRRIFSSLETLLRSVKFKKW